MLVWKVLSFYEALCKEKRNIKKQYLCCQSHNIFMEFQKIVPFLLSFSVAFLSFWKSIFSARKKKERKSFPFIFVVLFSHIRFFICVWIEKKPWKNEMKGKNRINRDGDYKNLNCTREYCLWAEKNDDKNINQSKNVNWGFYVCCYYDIKFIVNSSQALHLQKAKGWKEQWMASFFNLKLFEHNTSAVFKKFKSQEVFLAKKPEMWENKIQFFPEFFMVSFGWQLMVKSDKFF